MKYYEASVQVVNLDNTDIVTATSGEIAAAYDELINLLGISREKLEEYLADGGWVNGVAGLVDARNDPNVNFNFNNLKPASAENFDKRHHKVCEKSGLGDDASAFSPDVEDDFDAEW